MSEPEESKILSDERLSERSQGENAAGKNLGSDGGEKEEAEDGEQGSNKGENASTLIMIDQPASSSKP